LTPELCVMCKSACCTFATGDASAGKYPWVGVVVGTPLMVRDWFISWWGIGEGWTLPGCETISHGDRWSALARTGRSCVAVLMSGLRCSIVGRWPFADLILPRRSPPTLGAPLSSSSDESTGVRLRPRNRSRSAGISGFDSGVGCHCGHSFWILRVAGQLDWDGRHERFKTYAVRRDKTRCEVLMNWVRLTL